MYNYSSPRWVGAGWRDVCRFSNWCLIHILDFDEVKEEEII